MTARQRPWLPLFSPEPPLEDSPEQLLDAAPLYAGESALRIERLEEAGPLTRELADAERAQPDPPNVPEYPT